MKVKIFKLLNKSPEFIENEINNWMNLVNPKINNVLQSQSSVLGNSSVTTVFITIFYEDQI